ncbi:hypothetical protein VTK56DRAFT_8342 [Thermocarpiscus australiensis]
MTTPTPSPSHSHPSSSSPIVSLDPAHPVIPRPLIADILRTRYCIPGSVFLVEAIERCVPAVPVPLDDHDGHSHGHGQGHNGRSRSRSRNRRRRRRLRIVRVLLGDGELCIQALVRPEIHCFVDGGAVYEGCYVRVDKFELGWVEEVGERASRDVVDDGVGDPEVLERERGRRRGQAGKGGRRRVAYLVVGDMVTVGWNEEYLGILRREREAKEERDESVARREGGDIEEEAKVMPELTVKQGSGKTTPEAPNEGVKTQPDKSQLDGALEACPSNPLDKKRAGEPEDMSDSDDAFETLEICAERVEQRRVPIPTPDPRQQLQAAIIKQNKNSKNENHSRPLPWLSNDPTQPLKLTPLCSIPNLPYKQNWMVNVLAVIASLSDVQPAHLPPYRQRTARLADQSTTKHVHLTVFLDPEGFTPTVGNVVLLMGVKNHLFDGGSLRKYVSDRPKNGISWWIEDPERLGWCEEVVGRLREWWEAGG